MRERGKQTCVAVVVSKKYMLFLETSCREESTEGVWWKTERERKKSLKFLQRKGQALISSAVKEKGRELKGKNGKWTSLGLGVEDV